MTEKLMAAADALEAEYLAVANGEKKIGKMRLEPLVRAVQEMREAARAQSPQAKAGDKHD